MKQPKENKLEETAAEILGMVGYYGNQELLPIAKRGVKHSLERFAENLLLQSRKEVLEEVMREIDARSEFIDAEKLRKSLTNGIKSLI